MPDFNPSMAAGVEVPQFDLGKQLDVYNKAIQTKGLMDYAHALDAGVPMEQAVGHLARVNPELAHKALNEFQRSREVGALGNYAKSGNVKDLRVSPEQYTTASQGETIDYNLGAEQRARKAYEIMNEPDPAKKKQAWNDFGEDQVRQGRLNPRDWQRMRDNPSDLVLDNVIRGSMDTQKHMTATGQTAGAEAAARQNADPTKYIPGSERVVIPGQQQGGTPSPVGKIVPTYQTPQASPTLPAKPVTSPPSRVVASAGSSSVYGGKDVPNPSEKDYYKEAPSDPIGKPLESGRGVLDPGQLPAVTKATEQAHDMMAKDIQPAAAGAAKNKASLGSIRSELESGRVKTDRLAEVRLTIAGYLNGMGIEANTAGKMAGIDLPWGEALNKDATRMGLTYARQTEGAREAVQAIRIALVANPSLTASVQGNLKIISMMERGSDYDIERGKAANAYYKKQLDENGAGHLFNFDSWFSSTHSPSQFISKAVPYQLPPNGKDLQPGITYEWPKKDPNTGKSILDPKTHDPVMQTGVFNDKTNSFDY